MQSEQNAPESAAAPSSAPSEPPGADEAPLLAGDDVRVGPDSSDEPQAGATEPTD